MQASNRNLQTNKFYLQISLSDGNAISNLQRNICNYRRKSCKCEKLFATRFIYLQLVRFKENMKAGKCESFLIEMIFATFKVILVTLEKLLATFEDVLATCNS